MNFKNEIMVSLKLILVGIVIFSVIYPLLLGGIGQIWGDKAQGSLVKYDNNTVGSSLIGQNFEDPKYFRGRVSSINYDGNYSSSANLAPNNPLLTERLQEDLGNIKDRYQIENNAVPADIVTESGSGLDPHISPQAAYMQVSAVASHNNLDEKVLNNLIEEHTEEKLWGMFGQERVNVLKLNLSLKEVVDK
ncbi:MAG: potassium-transporting ATPase subunit KdpC [Halanaerobiales bacterium]